MWIPVSNINHDGSNKIKINSVTEEGVEITLGRYTFDTSSPGNPTLEENSYQYANTYSTTKMIERYYSEVTTVIETSIATARGVKVNNIWNGIQGFIESVEENKGYYIARYEASYRSNGKAGSIPSTSSDTKLSSTSAPSSRTVGDLWNYITQVDAAMACRDLYTTVNSDLMNSYAWDTAIIYIQAMGNTNYSNANRGSNTTLLNTGTTGDEKCKIFDMSANEYEWTTEESQQTSRTGRYPIVYRGGCFEEWANNKGTSSRSCTQSSYCNNDFSFRASLYL